MREIVSYKQEKKAQTFAHYLTTVSIENKLIKEDGLFEVWIYDENQLDEAKKALSDYKKSPKEMKFEFAHIKAKEINQEKERLEKIERKKRPKIVSGQNSFMQNGLGRITSILMIISVLVTFISYISQSTALINWLFFYPPQIAKGQIWRLLTPIFIFGTHDQILMTIVNLFISLLWLKDFGTAIELIQGRKFFILLLIIITFTSNYFQYQVVGPSIGGMMGVVYGLFGYIWMKAQFDPNSGYIMNQMTLIILLFFLALGFMGISNIANFGHLGGMLTGMIWGYGTSPHFKKIFNK